MFAKFSELLYYMFFHIMNRNIAAQTIPKRVHEHES